MTWIALTPLFLTLSMMRNFVVHEERLEVNYLFGLLRYFYDYKELKVSDYTWSTKGVLIELPDGDQLTIGERQYRNYQELKHSLEKRIQKEKIGIKYSNRFTRLLIGFGVFILILLLIGKAIS